MSHQLKTKTKFLLPISILLIAFLMLTTSLITTSYSKADSLKSLQKNVLLATKISQLIHETQKERGYSSGYTINHAKKFQTELSLQKKKTDAKILALKQLLQDIDNKDISDSMKEPLTYLAKLPSIREKVKNLQITSQKAIAFYSTANDLFLDVFIQLSKRSSVTKITQNLIAYSNLLYAKENAGLERAQGTIILSQNNLKSEQKVSFANLVASQELYLKMFLKFASNEAKIFYMQQLSGEDVTHVNTIRKNIFSKNSHFNIDPNFWFTQITSKIDKLKQIDSYLEKEILNNINQELDNANRSFTFFTLLNLLGLAFFIAVIVITLRLITNERRLKQINDKYIISSVTDTKGRIIDASDAFCTISGFSKKELIGKPHNIVRHPDMPKSAFKEMWSTIKQGKTWQGRVKNLKKDGGHYWVYANIEPIFDKKGNIEAYAAIRFDITDSINLKEELERSQQKDKAMLQQSKLAQMGEMIAMIAHQWRQPLTAISSTASDLHMKIILDNFNSDYFIEKLEKIDGFSQHLSKTIDDFRGFYKEDKEKIDILFSNIIQGALDIVATSITNKNITLETTFKSQQKIAVYPNELRQVILNLIKNAEDVIIEKKIQNPTIQLKTYEDDTYAYFETIDNAGGIPKEIIEKIFDPYFSTKTKKDGTGLGLYMSKTIVEEHCGGKLEVSNTTEGAKFKIIIPVVKEKNDV
ncbi:Aerotaxis sensor receptor protein [hydrothermal vent metagenome]|uniref:Aerotaxis sensor receptor protein n=1 Tax=hydrothermal vent metagenome TaxID=652676 RepID=A0A1W1CNF3_9ZZZZ